MTALLIGGAWWLHGTNGSTPNRHAGGTSANMGSEPLDLEVHDWRNAAIPGGLCRHQGSISLRDGMATNVSSTFDGPEPNMPQDVAAFTDEVVYGDLTGDGRWEAALPVVCANHDSTLAGQRSMGVMVFDGATGRLHHIGTLTSQQPRLGGPPNKIRIERITQGLITATETFYGTADANCCPTGLADSTWHFTRGKLVPASSSVRATPSAAP
ncbi:hypothetical protein [Streptomyces dubilierae]|uniref:Uncharacterized protein n=1 Tax=Streptomyces dubilierae TaxID=3075533 RepID=A0ABU2P2C7_9ACTN|nr:hypothetical protein [Streptomyces sp. DSM 41921]MDT0385972.1 hypothetical protein [Streptomyces sp. DSM 41921]